MSSFAAKLAAAAVASAGAGAFKPNNQQGGQYPQQQQQQHGGAYGQQQGSNSYGPQGQSQYGGPQQQSPYGGQQSYGGPPVQGGQHNAYGQQFQQQGQYGAYPQQQQPQQQQPQQQQSGSAASYYSGAAAGAALGGAAAYGAQLYGGQQQHGGQGQYGQPQGGQYGQQQGGYTGGPPPGAPPHGQQQQPYGAPPAPYGAPLSSYGATMGGGGGGADHGSIARLLDQTVQDQRLAAFYPPGSGGQIAQRVVQSGVIERICAEWRIPKEIGYDLCKLALFDVVILVDDSGSMSFEQNGERIVELKLILGKVAHACGLFDQDGLSVRFLNSPVQGDRITSEAQVLDLVGQVKFSGLTPLGTSLDQKVLQPALLGPARSGALRKPVLVIALTDGVPAGEANDHIFRVIQSASNELARSRYGPDALSIMFSQIGNDLKARDWLQTLDSNPQIGSLVDVTSNFESEADQMMKTTGIDLSPELWLCKLLLGACDSSYDSRDESRR